MAPGKLDSASLDPINRCCGRGSSFAWSKPELSCEESNVQTQTKFRHRVEPIVPDLSRLPDEALLVERQVAQLGGYAPHTLKLWRLEQTGRGPAHIVVEGRPRYPVAGVRAWLQGKGRAA